MPGILRAYTIARPDTATTTESDILIDRDGEAYRTYGITKDALVLVRPDGYVGLIAGSLEPQPIIDYLRDVTGGALEKTPVEQGGVQADEATEESQLALFHKFHNF